MKRGTNTSPYIRHSPEEEAQLLVQIACQRLAGWTWLEIAHYHGWSHHNAPRAWSLARVRLRLLGHDGRRTAA